MKLRRRRRSGNSQASHAGKAGLPPSGQAGKEKHALAQRKIIIGSAQLGAVLATVVFFVILEAFVAQEWVTFATAATLALATVLTMPRIHGAAAWYILFLFIVSVVLLIVNESAVGVLARGMVNGGQVLVFMFLAEVVGVALRAGKFDVRLTRGVARLLPGRTGLSRAATLGSFVLGLGGMFAAALQTTYYAIAERNPGNELLVATGSARGFSASALINPISPVVVLAIAASSISLPSYLLVAAPVCGLMLILSLLPHRAGSFEGARGQGVLVSNPENVLVGEHSNGLRYALLGIAALGATYALLTRFPIPNLIAVGLAVFAGGVILGLSNPNRFRRGMQRLPRERFTIHASAVPLFTLGGLLGELVVANGFLVPIAASISNIAVAWLQVPFIVLLVITLRWLGVPPLITLLVAGPVLLSAVTISPQLYALALVLGSVLAFLVTPLSGTNLFIASVTGKSPLTISLREQGWFCGATLVLVTGYVFLLA